MKLGRWGRVFSSVLVLSLLLAGFVFPLFETRVEASAQNALLDPVSGTSVAVENYSFSRGTLSFALRLSGCSDFQSANLTVTFSKDCAISNGGRNGGYVLPSTSSYSSAYFTGPKNMTVSTIDRSALRGEAVISISATVNQQATVSSVEVTSAVKKKEMKTNEECTIIGNPQFNSVSFGYFDMRGNVEMKVTKVYEKSGKDLVFSVNDGGSSVNIELRTKDLSPLTDMVICVEITYDGDMNLGLRYPNYSYIAPTPTPTPSPTPTPTPSPTPTPTPAPVPTLIPTGTPTPVPAVADVTETTALPTATPVPTATPKPTSTPTPVPESSETSETSEETTSEEPSETEPMVIVPVLPETEPSETETSEEPTTSEETKKAVVRASASSDDSTDYSTYILLGVLFIIVILVYLRYNHLAKKEMSFSDICKNFIPVGVVVEKVKSMKKAKEPDPEEPKPEVVNGYLQKPTVGMAAARAIRPVRSNVSGPNAAPKPENPEKAEVKQELSSPSAPQRPEISASAANFDPELLEIERRQKIMEEEMDRLFSNKKNVENTLPTEDAPPENSPGIADPQ